MSIIVHPEYKKLKDKLSNLIIEYETLKFQTCPNLETLYLVNFGVLEFELYRKDVRLSKLKRTLQLVQIQINHEADIDIDEIRRQVDEEFKQYEENIKKHKKELMEAMKNSQKDFLTEEQTKRLKLIYKQCVLKLHPDLNPNQTVHEKKLFIEITKAFKEGDLEKVEALYYLIPNVEMESESDCDKLKKLIESTEKEIEKIKESYPYNKRDLLSDDEKIAQYKSELQNLIKQFNDEISIYEKEIEELI